MSHLRPETLLKRFERRQRVFDLHERGHQPSDIGRRVGLRAESVRTILREAGLGKGPMPYIANSVDGVWGLSESARKQAFRDREKAGAAATLSQSVFD
ncbi:MAG TPA: hypothetical protein VGN80_19200 [Devosiaceae bacterium]|jgi:hypothetical protein|nr:hypothetical protein [Devosiaceae bacterium]